MLQIIESMNTILTTTTNTYYNHKYILQPQIHITTTSYSFFLNRVLTVFFSELYF